MRNLKNLGNFGISISPTTTDCRAFDGVEFRGEPFEKNVDNAVPAALRLGVNTFDTEGKYPPVDEAFGTILAERERERERERDAIVL
jgi:aryl-alcohol dehydrogenase-like predicted oxidoreductase